MKEGGENCLFLWRNCGITSDFVVYFTGACCSKSKEMWGQEMTEKKLAVFFPGVGYHCDKPLLYYGRDVACEAGYEEHINLTYSCDASGMRGNPQKMKEVFENLYAQAEKTLAEVNFGEYDKVLFVGKSVGTIIASAYAAKHEIDCKLVLQTPLEETFRFEPKNAIAFTGTADPWVDYYVIVKACEERNIPVHVYDGVNHSLEQDSVMKNLEILTDVCERMQAFLEE